MWSRTRASEVGPAILTAVTTTIVSFIPVFTMEAAEGKLFRPLAFTKSFALLACGDSWRSSSCPPSSS